MRLKRLETYGFKSFADRMSFDFEQGITAIIGPNGCGKSNIVDSIKWVVGEQSAKALRGADMSDVIFNGCATRRAMPMAEVTLVLERDDDAIDGGELALTRRLTRDGQSSYYLNGKPARLRDIREVLMGTGVGTSAYSVIEQGRIGFILEASTKDRRAILEEAAGISRYKTRRKVAARKLERVGLDLERIGQITGEVEKRLKTVRRQAAAALRYQELDGKLRELRMVFALEEFGRLSGEREVEAKAVAELQNQEAELAARSGELEANVAGDDTRLVELEAALRELEQTRADARSARDVAESRLQDAKYRLIEIDQQEAEDQQALEAHGERVAAVQREIDETNHNLENADGDGDLGLSQLYRTRREQLDGLLGDIDGHLAEIEDTKNREVECLRELARIEAELSRLTNVRQGLDDRRARLADKSQGQETQMAGARETETAARTALEQATEAVAEAHRQLDERIRQREEAQAAGGTLDTKLQDLRHEEGRAEVRLRLLSDLERKAEGLFRGVRDVIKQMDRFPGVCGIVADLFRVGKDHELAIETALGGRAQNIVTETQEAAREAIGFLKRERRGRATFLPLDNLRSSPGIERGILNAQGVVGPAVDLIEYEHRFGPAFDSLLGNVLVIESLEDAMAISRQFRHRPMMVTLDGEVVAPGGAMTGGRQQGADNGGLISRKNEIRRLEEQVTTLSEQREQMSVQRDEAKKKAFELAVAVEDQRKSIQRLERAAADAQSHHAKVERDRAHMEEFAASFGVQLEEIGAEQAQAEADATDLAGQQEWFSGLRDRLEKELTERQERLHERASERDRLQEEVSNLRVNLATSEERREALRNHAGHLARQLQELDDQRQERERRLAGHQARRKDLTEQANENQGIFDEQRVLFDELSVQVEAAVIERDGVRNAVETNRQELRKLADRSRRAERERSEHERRVAEIDVRIQGMSERILEDYEVDLAEAFTNYERPDNLDLPALRRDLAETERELARLGPVNLAAIDELKEVEARHEFLAKQHADLDEAQMKLIEIIDQIDTTSRKLFEKTYKEVRRNFQALFRKLYGGGTADMKLIKDHEEQDILEAGVEIIAQPPGKQPKSITLLSGGEKALTAIALLFGVYQTKPSPFCILDEVDAPLDESNTDIYCQMVREFCVNSQFLVITHNKRTMQFADAIYGVTQAERGVSTKISVKLDEVDEADELLSTAPGHGPFSD